jgi:hypothetical protein
MATRRNEFVVDVGDVLTQADRLALLADGRLNVSMADVVNDVAGRFDTRARAGMNAGINLSDAYISSKMSVARAAPGGKAEARITARGDLTILGNYNPVVQTVPASARAKGDPSRGVPAGQRASAVQVTVRKGTPREIPRAFTMRLKNSGKTGVFIREKDRVKHLYGVSPYSLFRFQVSVGLDDLGRDLTTTAEAAIVDAVGKVFKP